MKYYKIKNLKTGHEIFPSGLESEILSKMAAKPNHYGHPAREKKKSECDEFELSRIISEEKRQEIVSSYQEEIDGDGNTQMVLVEDVVDVAWVSLPADYEIEDLTIEHNRSMRKQKLISDGKKIDNVCNDVLALIKGYNKERNLTKQQRLDFRDMFNPIKEYLQDGIPDVAKQLISPIEADETAPQELIDMALDILRDY